MKKILFLMCCLSGWCFQSCDDYLDIKPKGYTIPEYYDDYALLMYGMSLYTTSDPLMNYLTDHVLLGDKDGLEEIALQSKSEEIRNLYCFAPGPVYLSGQSDRFYVSSYKNIFTYNVVINNVMEVPDANETQKLKLKGEALLGRAMEYLNLVNGYARHYKPKTAATDLGVPLVLNEDINSSYVRNTVQEVYDQIEKDVADAVSGLSDQVINVFQANRITAKALLARMYLYMGNYDKALSNAKEVLKVHHILLDLKGYISTEGGWDHIKDAEGELFPTNGTNPEDFFYRMDATDLSSEVCAGQDLIDCYFRHLPKGATDQRLALFFFKDHAFTWKPMDFPGKYLWAAYHTQNVGFAVPEMMLIAAECEARVGSKESAMNYVNQLRDYRIINNQSLSAGSQEEALRIVLDERRREMPYTGLTRLVDMKRLNPDERFRKTVTHTADGQTWTLPPDDNRYIMPIPPTVLEYNTGMPQYER